MRFLITAGPTREPIDPIRYLSNRSSGKMGYALAEAALESNHDVILISGPVCLNPPAGAEVIYASTSDEMLESVHQHAADCDVLVMTAAVADYKSAIVSPTKIKKHDQKLSLELKPTQDILRSLGQLTDRQFLLIGFAAETEEIENHAREKLQHKNCDLIVANDARVGMENAENEVTILFRDGKMKRISRAPKKNIARQLIKIFANAREKCLTKKM